MENKEQVEKKFADLMGLTGDEQVLCVIKKHPIGLMSMYLTGVLTAVATLIILTWIGLWMDGQSTSASHIPYGILLSSVGGLFALGILVYMYVGGYIYQHNIVVITNTKIAQVRYNSLINRRVSQFSIGEVQDVVVSQKGMLSRSFDYGTLSIETAGEHSKYTIAYVPKPYECSRVIVDAHEMSVRKYGN